MWYDIEEWERRSADAGQFYCGELLMGIVYFDKDGHIIGNTQNLNYFFDIPEINEGNSVKAASLVVKAKNGERSFKVEVAPPEGNSFARDIAEKYGVTFEMLTEEK